MPNNPLDIFESSPKDELSMFMRVLCIIAPVLGLVIFLINRNTFPNKAKAAGNAAAFGFVIGVISELIVEYLN